MVVIDNRSKYTEGKKLVEHIKLLLQSTNSSNKYSTNRDIGEFLNLFITQLCNDISKTIIEMDGSEDEEKKFPHNRGTGLRTVPEVEEILKNYVTALRNALPQLESVMPGINLRDLLTVLRYIGNIPCFEVCELNELYEKEQGEEKLCEISTVFIQYLARVEE